MTPSEPCGPTHGITAVGAEDGAARRAGAEPPLVGWTYFASGRSSLVIRIARPNPPHSPAVIAAVTASPLASVSDDDEPSIELFLVSRPDTMPPTKAPTMV